ncbi:MAG: hypothetical protein AAGG02_00775 [Cyanobacteria bacterium P01_H01_bin.15]
MSFLSGKKKPNKQAQRAKQWAAKQKSQQKKRREQVAKKRSKATQARKKELSSQQKQATKKKRKAIKLGPVEIAAIIFVLLAIAMIGAMVLLLL